MRMITACLARALQKDTSCIGMRFLLTFQEVMLSSKTRNQLERRDVEEIPCTSGTGDVHIPRRPEFLFSAPASLPLCHRGLQTVPALQARTSRFLLPQHDVRRSA